MHVMLLQAKSFLFKNKIEYTNFNLKKLNFNYMQNKELAFSLYAAAKIIYAFYNKSEDKTLKALNYFQNNRHLITGDEESGFYIHQKYLTPAFLSTIN